MALWLNGHNLAWVDQAQKSNQDFNSIQINGLQEPIGRCFRWQTVC